MRSIVTSALVVGLVAVLAPSSAQAQQQGAGGTGGQAAPPPPGGGTSTSASPSGGGAGPAGTTGSDDAKKTPHRDAAGFTFTDKPAAAARRPATARASGRHAAGPHASYPGFEQLPDGGSRLFVHLSQSVPVEERRAQGSVTYVLKGAHVRVHNDTNALVTVHFNTPVATARLVPHGADLHFVVSLRGSSTPTFKVQDAQDKTATLTIDFPQGDFSGGEVTATAPAEPGAAPAHPAKVTKASARKQGAPPPAPKP